MLDEGADLVVLLLAFRRSTDRVSRLATDEMHVAREQKFLLLCVARVQLFPRFTQRVVSKEAVAPSPSVASIDLLDSVERQRVLARHSCSESDLLGAWKEAEPAERSDENRIGHRA